MTDLSALPPPYKIEVHWSGGPCPDYLDYLPGQPEELEAQGCRVVRLYDAQRLHNHARANIEADRALRQAGQKAVATVVIEYEGGHQRHTAEFVDSSLPDGANLYTVLPPTHVPLSEVQLYDWWRSDNGLEDCSLQGFTKVARAIERQCALAWGVTLPEVP
jgi:hypothetical protein